MKNSRATFAHKGLVLNEHLGALAVTVSDTFSLHGDGNLAGMIAATGQTWGGTGAQLPKVASGKMTSDGNGYAQIDSVTVPDRMYGVASWATGTANSALVTLIAGTDFSLTNMVHFFITDAVWGLQVRVAGGSTVTLLSGSTAIVRDGRAYNVGLRIAGSTVTVELPDGTEQSVTDGRLSAVWGRYLTYQVLWTGTGGDSRPSWTSVGATVTQPVFDQTKAQDHIGVDRLVIRPQFRDLREGLHLAQGGTAGHVHKGLLSMQAQGRILVPNATQSASLEDREKALRLAFDPYECYRDSPGTEGVYALSWLEPTLDLTDYPTGWMPVTRYVRPTGQPETVWTITDQSYRSWAVGLVAPDPRLYDAALGTAVVVTPFSSTNIVNHGTIPGPLRVTVAMSGAGASNFTITRSGVSFVLDLTGLANLDVVVVVMETCGPFGVGKSVKKNGTAAWSRKTSGPTSWLDAPVGTTAFTHANTTGIDSVSYEWGHARP